MSLGRRYRSRGHERQPGLSGRLPPIPGRVHWWLGVVCGLLWLGLWPAWLSAEEQGSISGVIQHEGRGVAAHRIMLIRRGPQQEVQRTPGQTDAQGGFHFEHLATGHEYTYFVGIRYEGQLYSSDPVVLDPGQQVSGVVMALAEPSGQTTEAATAPSPIRIANHLIVVVLQEDHLAIREVLHIVNSASTPYRGAEMTPGSPPFSLALPLPQDYANLSGIQGLAATHVRTYASGVYYTAPLAPGAHRVEYSYTLPLRSKVSTLLLPRVLDTAALSILVEATRLDATSDLPFGGRVAFEAQTFLHFRGTALTAQSRSWVQLVRHTGTDPLLRLGAYGLVIGLACLGLVAPFYERWHSREPQETPRPLSPAQRQELSARKQRLLQRIVHLDEQYEAGLIAESAYQQQRQAEKTQLLALEQQLRTEPIQGRSAGTPQSEVHRNQKKRQRKGVTMP
jgi:hypothetical protein